MVEDYVFQAEMLFDGPSDKEAHSKPFVNIIYLNLARTGSSTPQPSKALLGY